MNIHYYYIIASFYFSLPDNQLVNVLIIFPTGGFIKGGLQMEYKANHVSGKYIDDDEGEEFTGGELPPTDYEHLEDSIRARLVVEIFHNFGCMSNKVYFTKYDTNAEALDRDYKIWKQREGAKSAKKTKKSQKKSIQ